jgi:suppressor of G2 allele of SKP1
MADSQYLEQLLSAQFNYMKGYYGFALEQFTTLLQAKADHYETGLYRAYCNLNLKNFDDLISDADKLISLNSNRFEGLFLKATALFEKKKLDEAKKEIDRAKLLVSSLETSDKKRVQVEALGRKIDALDGSRILKKPEPKAKPVQEQKARIESTNSQAQFHPAAGKVTYSWVQTDKQVEINFKWSLQKKEALKLDFQTETVIIEFPTVGDKVYSLKLVLADEIIPDQCSHKIVLDRIQVILIKKEAGEWPLLESEESTNERVLETLMPKAINQPQKVSVQENTPSYPSSAKVKRDWSKIDKEIEDDMEKNKDDY